MSRIIAVALTALALGGCADAAKVADLEKRIEALEAAQKAAPVRAEKPDASAQQAREAEAAKMLGEGQRMIQSGDRDGGIAKLTECRDAYKDTRTGARCGVMLAEAQVIGAKAKPMAVKTWLQGEAELGGKPTVIVFWELWCPHCKREVPKIEAMSKEWKSKGVQFVGLTKGTRNTSEDAIRSFIKEQGLTYPMGIEDGSTTREYQVRGVPAAAFVDSEGVIQWRGHPAQLNDDQLKKLLDS